MGHDINEFFKKVRGGSPGRWRDRHGPCRLRLLSKAWKDGPTAVDSPERDCAHWNLRDFQNPQRAEPARRRRFPTSSIVLSSFLQMRHGVISLLADDACPDITVGVGWNEGSDERYRLACRKRRSGRSSRPRFRWSPKTSRPIRCSAQPTRPRSGHDGDVRVSFIGVPIRIGDEGRGHLDHRSRLGRSIGVPARCRCALPDHDRQSDRPDRAAPPRRLARPRSADGGELPAAEGAVGAQAGAGAQEGSHQGHHRRQSGDCVRCSRRSRSSPNPIRPCCCAANPAPARS